jgi:hypothetical protein
LPEEKPWLATLPRDLELRDGVARRERPTTLRKMAELTLLSISRNDFCSKIKQNLCMFLKLD